MTTTLKPNLSPRYGYVDSVFAAINNDVEAWAILEVGYFPPDTPPPITIAGN